MMKDKYGNGDTATFAELIENDMLYMDEIAKLKEQLEWSRSNETTLNCEIEALKEDADEDGRLIAALIAEKEKLKFQRDLLLKHIVGYNECVPGKSKSAAACDAMTCAQCYIDWIEKE